jgi:hypothetical protein
MRLASGGAASGDQLLGVRQNSSGLGYSAPFCAEVYVYVMNHARANPAHALDGAMSMNLPNGGYWRTASDVRR